MEVRRKHRFAPKTGESLTGLEAPVFTKILTRFEVSPSRLDNSNRTNPFSGCRNFGSAGKQRGLAVTACRKSTGKPPGGFAEICQDCVFFQADLPQIPVATEIQEAPILNLAKNQETLLETDQVADNPNFQELQEPNLDLVPVVQAILEEGVVETIEVPTVLATGVRLIQEEGIETNMVDEPGLPPGSKPAADVRNQFAETVSLSQKEKIISLDELIQMGKAQVVTPSILFAFIAAKQIHKVVDDH